jgi:hypothetical protein
LMPASNLSALPFTLHCLLYLLQTFYRYEIFE